MTLAPRAVDIPPAWERSAALILQRQWRKVCVLGATDRGKSTYCKFLTQRCLEAGRSVAVVDADVGQKDVGPPATLTLGYPQPDQDWSTIDPAAWYFVGATSPSGHLLPMVVGLRRLVDAARASCVIINTTGFVQGIGRILKHYKIDMLQPDVIVALEYARELASLLQPYRQYRILRLPSSSHATSKTSQQRQAARQRAFRAYFRTAQEVRLPLAHVVFQRTLALTGRRVPHATLPYLERTAEGLLAMTDDPSQAPAEARILPVGFAQALLCGLAGQHHQGLGLAIVDHIDFAQESVVLWTPVPARRIHVIQLGSIYVSHDGHELPRRLPHGVLL